jgi:hypothetical protein
MELRKELGSPSDCVLCFDGIMVKSKADDFDLLKIEKNIRKTLGISIQLAVKPMDQGFQIDNVEAYVEPVISTSFDFDDPYTYQSFQNEYKEYKFQSWDDAHEVFRNIYPKVIGRVLRGEGSYIKKEANGHVDIVKKLGASDFTIYIANLQNPAKRFSDYLFKQNGFGNYVCKLEDCKPTDFNMWSGFGSKLTEEKTPGFDLMKKFVYETWADNNEDNYNYIISWFAGLLTNKKSINMVALAMIAKPGTGKGFFLSFMKYILRSVNVCEITGIGPITQKHNTCLQNKRLVVINEMSSTRDEFRSNFDKLKTYITDPVITIEPKGVNSYQIDNISNFLLFSNHRDVIIVEESDRRYAIFEMSECHLNDTVYFNMLEKECFNQETADAFYTYLVNFSAVEVRNIPNTVLRREMMDLSKSTPLKFLDAIDDENIFDSPTVSASEFYTRYQRWCSDNGEKNTYSSTKFGASIKSKIQKKRTSKGYVYVLDLKL